jgi:linearmycin/streptolysin S transport system ATP-binding protein
VLSCRGLRKQFATRLAVDGVSFDVAAGECYGLLGPNGAGKTTTISMVCGLLEPDAGEVTVDGAPGGSMPARAALGYVPQDLALYPDLTARENLEFFGRLYGLSGDTLTARIGEALELVGLADRGGDRVGTYSGGMKRRANMAAGLLHRPRLLVLDEPTVGVDPQSRNAILETVGALGIAVLYTTHYMEEAAKLCRRVGIIDDGRLIAEGTPRALVEAHGGADRISLSFGEDGAAPGGGDTRADAAATAVVAELCDACRRIPGVDDARAVEGGAELSAAGGAALIPDVVKAAEAQGVVLTGIEVHKPDLEGVFLALTGKELRD